MGANNFRGVYVPDIDEDIHQGITTLADGLGVVTRVSSIAAARTIVEANQASITPASPAYFDINGLIYVHDGTVFKPVNESESYSQSYTYNHTSQLSAGQFSGMVTSNISAKPYDRSFTVWGMAWGRATLGTPFLALRINGLVTTLAPFQPGEVESVTVMALGEIPAGTQPEIQLGVYGGSGTGGEERKSNVELRADERLSRLMVKADPISMA